MSVVISFRTREVLPPPPPLPPPAPPIEFFVRIERLSCGSRRTFWVDDTHRCREIVAQPWPWPSLVLPPVASWTSEIFDLAVQELAPRLPEDDEPLRLERLMAPWRYPGQGSTSIDICVRRGRWRARLDLCLESELPGAIRERILSLPESVDSWTDEKETKAQIEKARERATAAKLAKVRQMLRERPDAWPTVESVLDGLLLNRGAL